MYDRDDPAHSRVGGAIVARPGPSANRQHARGGDREPVAPSRGKRGSHPAPRPARRTAQTAQGWPPDIAFLVHYGVAPAALSAAVTDAERAGVTAQAALLAAGTVPEDHYYRALARHLRLPFIDGDVLPGRGARYPQSLRAGLAPLAATEDHAFLVAPRGIAISQLILTAYRGELDDRLALTTPTHFAKVMGDRFREEILHDASFALADRDLSLSAKSKAQHLPRFAAAGIAALALVSILTLAGSRALSGVILGVALLAVAIFRLLITAASIEARPQRNPPLADRELPLYSIVVALYREARMVPQLAAALEAIDYPRAKLEIKFVVEEDDAETLRALRKTIRQPGCEIIIAPDGAPRTKPRALNVALPVLRGACVTVFDAEDIPEPTQLRRTAERFAGAPEQLACLQARLAINNSQSGWLPAGIMAQTPPPRSRLSEGGGAVRAINLLRHPQQRFG